MRYIDFVMNEFPFLKLNPLRKTQQFQIIPIYFKQIMSSCGSIQDIIQ